MKVRPEEPRDADAVVEVHREAFGIQLGASIASRRRSIASAERPARLSQQATL